MVKKEARANFNKDQALRHWTSMHGGVYVPVTKETPSNPYLSHVPERDLKTPSGKSLTLMNPAYMLRQTMESYEDLYGVRGHITSLKHFRPETAPDEWEKYALKKFEQGAQEIFEFTDMNGKPYFRLISPMITKKECLKCHGHQGYKVGDVRGGVSVSVPMAPYLATQKRQIIVYAILFAILWVLGCTGINLATRGLRRRIIERDKAKANLQKAHAELEVLVEKRTAELKEANEQLRQVIEEGNLAEEALRRSEDKYRSLIETTSDWIWEVDQNYIYIYASPKIKDLLGYEPQEVVGKTPFDYMPADEAKRVRGLFRDIVDSRESFNGLENINLHKDGRRVVLETSGAPVFDEDGNLMGYRGVDRDISDRKQAEEKKTKLQNQLQQARKIEAIGTLAGGIAHQFNNALSVITGNVDMLELDFPDEEKITAYTKQMKDSTTRMALLTDQLLAYARGGQYHVITLSFRDFVRDTLLLIKHTVDSAIHSTYLSPRS